MYKIYADGILFFDDTLQSQSELQLLSVKLTMEVNRAGALEFTMPTHNVAYNTLQKLKTTIIVICENRNAIYWEGRVLHDEKDFLNRKKVYCEGALSYLTDAVLIPYNWNLGGIQNFFSMIIRQQNERVENNRRINFIRGDFEDPNQYIVRSNQDYSNVWDEIVAKILKPLGGYLNINYGWFNFNTNQKTSGLTVSLDSSPGGISDQVIRFSENLLDIEEYITAENIFTVIVPLGARQKNQDGSQGGRLTIKSVNNDLDYLENQTAINLFGRIVRTAEWDDVTLASNLKTKGRAFLNNNISMAVTLSVKAVDLHYLDVDTDKIEIGTQVRVVSEPHGLDTYFLCSKVVADFLSPEKTQFVLGSGFNALTDKQVDAAKMTSSAMETAASASSAVSKISTDIVGNYVSRSEFTSFQSQVNSNFTAVDNKLTAAMHYKGSVASVLNLPSSGNSVGDVYNATDTGANYTWTGTAWDKLSESATYTLRTDFDALEARVRALENA